MDNPTSPAPIPPKPPISLNLAFLIITFVSLFLSVFFIYQNWRLTQKLNALVQSQSIPTPSVANPPLVETPSVDATSSWKTYTNSTGYSIKYPSTLKTQLIAAGSKADEEANATSRQFIIYKIGSINPYDERYIDFATTQLEPSYDNRMVTQTTLNGYPVKKISFPNIQFEAYSIKTPKGEFIEIYVSKDPTKTTLANQILSTFKFVDQTSRVDTSNWKTYSFPIVGLAFKAPANLSVELTETKNSNTGASVGYSLYIQNNSTDIKKFYQLYGAYQNPPNTNYSEKDLEVYKQDLIPDSITSVTIDDHIGIRGQISGQRNRYVTHLLINNGLLSLFTAEPTVDNEKLSNQIIDTFKFTK